VTSPLALPLIRLRHLLPLVETGSRDARGVRRHKEAADRIERIAVEELRPVGMRFSARLFAAFVTSEKMSGCKTRLRNSFDGMSCSCGDIPVWIDA
jgi:hypothetical protein